MTSFWLRHHLTSAKLRHQNDVTKIFHFQAPTLAKSWLRPWLLQYLFASDRTGTI